VKTASVANISAVKLDAGHSLTVAQPLISLIACQLLLIGQLIGTPAFSAALALLVVSSGVLGGIRGCTAYTNLWVFFDSVYSPQ